MARFSKTGMTQQQRREESRSRLLEAGMATLALVGYERATVDRISERAGYSKGAFYHHFHTKEDLFWALLEQRMQEQLGLFQSTIREAPSSRAAVGALVQRMLQATKADAAWVSTFTEFLAHAVRRPAVRERVAQFYARWRGIIGATLRTFQAQGAVRGDLNPETTATVLIALVNGVGLQSALDPSGAALHRMVPPVEDFIVSWLFEPAHR